MATEEEVVDAARHDLARVMGVSPDTIFVKHIESVVWPHASLGYPARGKTYTRTITPGYRLVLSDGRANVEYHADRNGKLVLVSK